MIADVSFLSLTAIRKLSSAQKIRLPDRSLVCWKRCSLAAYLIGKTKLKTPGRQDVNTRHQADKMSIPDTFHLTESGN